MIRLTLFTLGLALFAAAPRDLLQASASAPPLALPDATWPPRTLSSGPLDAPRGVDPSPWADALALSTCNESEYRRVVLPIAQIVANTYRYPKLKPVDGWALSLRMPPLGGPVGLHALVYEEQAKSGNSSEPRRLIVAFRGTQITFPPTLGTLCDLCADAFLYNDLDKEGLPAYCELFPPRLYDYFTSAKLFIYFLLSEYKTPDNILFTGHSLGGDLATMISIYSRKAGSLFPTRAPVVSFSAGGVRNALLRRNLPVPPGNVSWLHAILDRWDPFYQEHPSNRVGNLCLYSPAEPPPCKLCYGEKGNSTPGVFSHKLGFYTDFPWESSFRRRSLLRGPPPRVQSSSSGYYCSKCFFATHYYKHILELLYNSPRPDCHPVSE